MNYNHVMAIAVLNAHPNAIFKEKIFNLYSKIDALSDEKDKTINILKISLQCKVDSFVNNNAETPPMLTEYNQFKNEFLTILHSHDDELLPRHINWCRVAINITIAVLGVGVVLGAKLIHSKLSTGQFSFLEIVLLLLRKRKF